MLQTIQSVKSTPFPTLRVAALSGAPRQAPLDLLEFGRWKSGKKKAHKHKLFCPVGLGTTPGLSRGFHRFVHGINSVKTWDKAGFSPYFTQWKPGKPGFVPGTSRVCPWDKPGAEGRHRKFMWQNFMCLFRSLGSFREMCLQVVWDITDKLGVYQHRLRSTHIGIGNLAPHRRRPCCFACLDVPLSSSHCLGLRPFNPPRGVFGPFGPKVGNGVEMSSRGLPAPGPQTVKIRVEKESKSGNFNSFSTFSTPSWLWF